MRYPMPSDTKAKAADVSQARRRTPLVRWILYGLLTAVIGYFLWICSKNPNFEWDVVAHYFCEDSILHGVKMTLGLTVVSMSIGIVLGLVCALAKLSTSLYFNAIANVYLWFFRSTPLLVQLLFWYNLAALFPTMSLPGLGSVPTNDVITPLTAAVIGLSLNEGAFMGEIIRAGLLSVDPNQKETAQAFGMSRRQIMFRILIPQAMTAIIPPTGNQIISMVKATAMVSIIAMDDLLYSVQTIYNVTFQVIPLLIVAVAWYLVITSVLSVLQWFIERHFAKGRTNRGDAAQETLSAQGAES
jgi:polar amino acid transport system permease protein